MKQFLIVLKFELNNYFKNKSFMITTLVLAILLAGVIIVPTFVPGLLGDSESTEEIVDLEEDLDELGLVIGPEAGLDEATVLSTLPAKWTIYESEKALKDAVEEKKVEAGFFVNSPSDVKYVVNDLEMTDYLAETFGQVLTQCYRQQYMLEQGVPWEAVLAIESIAVNVEKEVLGKDSAANYGYTYILVFVVYFLIIFYGQMIATSVTTEKSNRAIEILVTSVNSNSLICGKVLAGAIAGVLQAGVILGSAFAAYGYVGDKWDGLLDALFDIPMNVLVVYLIFAILSYVLYSFIFGMLGALVSKTEDISKSSSPIVMLYVASFIIAMFGMTESNSTLMRVASYIPFTSGNAMFIRVSMGSVATWEVLLSAALLIVSCVIVIIMAAKIFRYGTLHYGNPIKLKTALKKASLQK